MNPTLYDWLGREITAGTEIIYPTRTGSSTDVVHARVEQVVYSAQKDRFKLIVTRLHDTAAYKGLGQRAIVRAVERVTVLR